MMSSEVSFSFAVSLRISMTAALSMSAWGDLARRLLRRLTTDGESTVVGVRESSVLRLLRTTDGESADAVLRESTEFSGFRVDKESASSRDDSNNASCGGRSGD
jgi:hypothetical protein